MKINRIFKTQEIWNPTTIAIFISFNSSLMKLLSNVINSNFKSFSEIFYEIRVEEWKYHTNILKIKEQNFHLTHSIFSLFYLEKPQKCGCRFWWHKSWTKNKGVKTHIHKSDDEMEEEWEGFSSSTWQHNFICCVSELRDERWRMSEWVSAGVDWIYKF